MNYHRKCDLPECNVEFDTNKPNRIYCCHDHGIIGNRRKSAVKERKKRAGDLVLTDYKHKTKANSYKKIKCLKCDKPFWSGGKGNRICDGCLNVINYMGFNTDYARVVA
jgi:hypothetical protein